MKKLILLFITLTTFTNESYASFPVSESETEQIFIEESEEDNTNIYIVLSLVLGILWYPILIIGLSIVDAVSMSIVLALIGLGSLVFGIKGLKNKKFRWVSLVGILLSLVCLYHSWFLNFWLKDLGYLML